ncbi:MAG TPA: alpha/beta fold hydrolase [Actinomycetota bacterium]|nr:alpha/beta fold hydrolase [Actinomycetota bacterium]
MTARGRLLTILLAGSVACGGGGGPAPSSSPSPTQTSSILPPAADPAIPDLCLNDSIEVVHFPTSDGVTLAAAVLGSGTKGVLLAHMGGTAQNLCAWLPFAQTLADDGYLVLDIDMRGFGASGYSPDQRYDLDVVAGVAELRRRGATTIDLMGGSLGAIAALTGGVRADPPVDGIISLSSPADPPGFGVPDAVRGLRVPVLFVAAEDDAAFGRDARTLYREAPTKDKTLKIYPGFDHGIDLLRFDLADRVGTLVRSWLARHSG